MSEFTVCRTLDTHPALRYCLLLDDTRIAGGKPDYRGNNYITSWVTNETYGPVDELKSENAKLRELVEDMLDCIEIRMAFGRPPTYEMYEGFAQRAGELGIEVG